MSDQPVRTLVHTDEGVLPFQRYFVYRRCEPQLLKLEFAGLAAARPSPQVLAALDSASAVILCPSNPYLSLDPILLLPGLADRLCELTVPVVAVSPIIGGQALKGPAAKIMAELGVEASAVAVAKQLAGRIRLDGFVLDSVDANLADEVAALEHHPASDGHDHAQCDRQRAVSARGVDDDTITKPEYPQLTCCRTDVILSVATCSYHFSRRTHRLNSFFLIFGYSFETFHDTRYRTTRSC